MKKLITGACILCIMSSSSFAQDLLSLKDGSSIAGKLLVYEKDKIIKFRLSSGDTLTLAGISMKTLAGLTIGTPAGRGEQYLDYTSRPIFGLMLGTSLDNENGALLVGGRVHVQGGYSFTHFFETSVAAGYEDFDRLYLLTTDLVISGDLFQRNITPFYDIRVGQSNAKMKDQEEDFWDENTRFTANSGIRFSPSVGVNFKHSSAQYRISFGYQTQEISETIRSIDWQGNPTIFETKRKYNRGTLNLTILF